MTRDASSYVDYIDDTAWQRMVSVLLNFEGAEILTRHSKEIFTGIGAGSRLYRVAGTAAAGRRRPVEWTVVIKMLTLDLLSFQSIGTDQTSWDYWKREWHVYQSAWQQQLRGPLVAPRCLATGEIPADTHMELAWIAMEDLEAIESRPWPASHFHEVARHVGVFNGDYLGGVLPADPWLSRGWIRGWTELAEPLVEMLPKVSSHPVAGRIYTPDLIDDLIELWSDREKLYEALDQLPKTLCHNDLFPRNLFIRGKDHYPNQSVAIDWAFCGEGPVGQELTTLVGGTQVFFESRPEHWDDLERDCLEGYAEGLRQVGWEGRDEILLGYLLSTVLHFGIGALTPMLGVTLTNEHQDLVAQVSGRSYDEFVGNVAAAQKFQQRRIYRARALLGI